jgi:hypothetical protein
MWPPALQCAYWVARALGRVMFDTALALDFGWNDLNLMNAL